MKLWSQGFARVCAVRPFIILAIGFAIFVLYAFPGYMSADSVQQLYEARSGVRAQSQVPAMEFEWSILDSIIAGPILMFLLQGSLFLGGLYRLFGRIVAPRPAAWLAAAIFLFPPVLTTMAVIWKDCQMAAFLIAGAAALLSERRPIHLVGLLLLTAACALRYNAFGAAVPLIGLLFVWRPGLRWWKRYAISGATAIVAVVVALGANRVLTVETQYMTPAFADICGVLANTRDRSDDDLRYVFRGTHLLVDRDIQARAKELYSPRNPYWVDHGPRRMFDWPENDEQRTALTRAWREILRSDWSAYFRYRLAGFLELLGLSDAPLWSPVYAGFVQFAHHPDLVDHNAVWSGLQLRLIAAFTWLADDTKLFYPYIYALIALGLLLVACRDRLTFALLTSGLLYELSYAFAGGTPDYRYSHWMITCTCISATVLFVERYRKGRA